MSAKKSAQEIHDAIFDQLLEGIECSSPEQLLSEKRAAGEDVEGVADRTRQTLLSGVRQFTQKKLEEARQTHKARTRMLSRRVTALPATPLERRNMLVTWAQNSGAQLTARFRDLSELTDNDVISALEELMQLEELEKVKSETDVESK